MHDSSTLPFPQPFLSLSNDLKPHLFCSLSVVFSSERYFFNAFPFYFVWGAFFPFYSKLQALSAAGAVWSWFLFYFPSF